MFYLEKMNDNLSFFFAKESKFATFAGRHTTYKECEKKKIVLLF